MKGLALLLLGLLSLCPVCLSVSLLRTPAFQGPPAAAAAAAAKRAAVTATAAAADTPPAAAAAATAAGKPMKRVALFSGQGAQCIGMGVECARRDAAARLLFEEASSILNFDLFNLLLKGPQEKLNETQIAQPALLTASVALFTSWKRAHNVEIDCCAGLSLGEYSALCCSGVLSFAAAVELTAKRGALMQQAAAANPGEMYAILGLSQQQTEAVCAAAAAAARSSSSSSSSGEDVYCGVANYLCPGNYAVSVSRSAAAALQQAAAAAAAKRCVRLQVSGAFHSPLMAPAAAGLAAAIAAADFQTPQTPVLLNVDAQIHTNPQAIKQKLIQQLTSPTQWQQSMELLGRLGMEESFEFGPGGILSKLNSKINPHVRTVRVE
uniref:Malonyl-CoA:acyl carrier protein transacylase n=1 Tax=Eimeria tenella TaxID=5802 RepID=D5LKE7_EIMTE|nr:malonyl-CoA:acyl carrier protein transacylase [Eimeria tenella]